MWQRHSCIIPDKIGPCILWMPPTVFHKGDNYPLTPPCLICLPFFIPLNTALLEKSYSLIITIIYIYSHTKMQPSTIFTVLIACFVMNSFAISFPKLDYSNQQLSRRRWITHLSSQLEKYTDTSFIISLQLLLYPTRLQWSRSRYWKLSKWVQYLSIMLSCLRRL